MRCTYQRDDRNRSVLAVARLKRKIVPTLVSEKINRRRRRFCRDQEKAILKIDKNSSRPSLIYHSRMSEI